MQSKDASAALSEAYRVLRPGGHLLTTAFLLPGESREPRRGATSRFHRTSPSIWQFDRPLDQGMASPSWAEPPERAIGISLEYLAAEASHSGFDIFRIEKGTWRERRGLYFRPGRSATISLPAEMGLLFADHPHSIEAADRLTDCVLIGAA